MEEPVVFSSTSREQLSAGCRCEVKRSSGKWVTAEILKREDEKLTVEFRDDEGKLFQKIVPVEGARPKDGSRGEPKYAIGEVVELLVGKEWVRGVVCGEKGVKLKVQFDSGRQERLIREECGYIRKLDPALISSRQIQCGELVFALGKCFDVKDIAGKWCLAEVVEVHPPKSIRVHYIGFDRKWDELIHISDASRFAAEGRYTSLPSDERFQKGMKVSIRGAYKGFGDSRPVKGEITEVDGAQVLVRYANVVRRFHRWFLTSGGGIGLLEEGNDSSCCENETGYEVSDFIECKDPVSKQWSVAEIIAISGKRVLVRAEAGKDRWIHVERDSKSLRGLSKADEQIQREEAEVQFLEMLSDDGFGVEEIPKDGNCMYRAVAWTIFGKDGDHKEVRRMCFDYILENRDYFSMFLEEDLDEYVAKNRKDGVWGGEPELYAMSELFNKRVEIYHQGFEDQPTNVMNEKFTSLPVIRLSYHGKSHYNLVIDPFNPPPLGTGSMDKVSIREARIGTSALPQDEQKEPFD